MIDFIVICIVALAVAAAGRYVYKAKKSGRTCSGCPDGCACGSQKHSGGCGCQTHR